MADEAEERLDKDETEIESDGDAKNHAELVAQRMAIMVLRSMTQMVMIVVMFVVVMMAMGHSPILHAREFSGKRRATARAVGPR